MAGYVGARQRTGVLSRRGGSGARTTARVHAPSTTTGDGRRAVDMPRRGLRGVTAVRAQRRQARIGYVMIGIVVAFLLGLFSLSQTVHVSAMDYDLDGLLGARQQLDAVGRDLRATIARLGSEPAIRRQALDAGLTPVIEPVVLPAR
jgi:hypothetical protein